MEHPEHREGRKELNALQSKGDGSGEGGPEPALCHPVMSTRCGAACGPKQTASQGTAPACVEARLRPSRELSQALPTDSQAPPPKGGPGPEPYLPGGLELRATPTRSGPKSPRERSGSPPAKATSFTPCQLGFLEIMPCPSVLSVLPRPPPSLIRPPLPWARTEGSEEPRPRPPRGKSSAQSLHIHPELCAPPNTTAHSAPSQGL